MIEVIIKEIIEKCGVSYFFGSQSMFNVKADDVAFPAGVYFAQQSGALNVSHGLIQESANCQIGFFDLTEFDFDSKENDEIVEQCKHHLKTFVAKINEEPRLNGIEGNLPYVVIYSQYDTILTGVIADITISISAGIPECAL